MNKHEFENKCKEIRRTILEMKYKTKASHIGNSLSCTDILVYLYYVFLKIDFNKNNQARDFFILSKGHAATTVYAILYDKGVLSEDEIDNYYKDGSKLGDHVSNKIKGVEVSTGSLGHGLSIGAGMALGGKLDNKKYSVAVLLGDGECNEGSVWEAAAFSSTQKLNNLIAIVDYNKFQGFGRSNEILNLPVLKRKWKEFGFEVYEINGNNFEDIDLTFHKIINSSTNKPKAVIANTKMGFGISFMEDKLDWHYKSPNNQEYKQGLEELK